MPTRNIRTEKIGFRIYKSCEDELGRFSETMIKISCNGLLPLEKFKVQTLNIIEDSIGRHLSELTNSVVIKTGYTPNSFKTFGLYIEAYGYAMNEKEIIEGMTKIAEDCKKSLSSIS